MTPNPCTEDKMDRDKKKCCCESHSARRAAARDAVAQPGKTPVLRQNGPRIETAGYCFVQEGHTGAHEYPGESRTTSNYRMARCAMRVCDRPGTWVSSNPSCFGSQNLGVSEAIPLCPRP